MKTAIERPCEAAREDLCEIRANRHANGVPRGAAHTQGRSDGYGRRLASNLRRNAAACIILEAVGIGRSDAELLGLGIKEPYRRADGALVAGVLSYPLGDSTGRAKFGCVNLPGHTENPEHAVAWNAGDPTTIALGSGTAVLILADGPIPAWRLALAAKRSDADVTVITSSQPDRMPVDWRSPVFWDRWPRLIVLQEMSEAARANVVAAARRPMEVANVGSPLVVSADGSEDDEWLQSLLARGGSSLMDVAGQHLPERDEGDFPAEAVSLHGGFVRGRLLYPFRVERRHRDSKGGRILHSYQTLVLRSDGALLEGETLPAPHGTPRAERVVSLTDGTRIERLPEPSRTQSWSLGGIQNYANAMREGRDPLTRPVAQVVSDVHAWLGSKISLPHPADLWVVTAFVLTTHMFRVFSALPILLVVGERGSGKSELGSAIAALSFNATTMGQGSASALVRVGRECGGLVVVDDVEGLSDAGPAFGELSQCLKVGYKAATARKPIAQQSGKVEVFDFFGPRVVTCTRGVDAVLGSRCIVIQTARAVPPPPGAIRDPLALRDELHALAMSRAAGVAVRYRDQQRHVSTRDDEIRLPLLAVAETIGCPEMISAITCPSVRVIA